MWNLRNLRTTADQGLAVRRECGLAIAMEPNLLEQTGNATCRGQLAAEAKPFLGGDLDRSPDRNFEIDGPG